jgi:glycosyltransferase involved in cell wall biosynthesis
MNVLVLTNLYPSPREPTRGLFNWNKFRALAHFCPVQVVAPVPAWKRVRHPRDFFHPVSDAREGILATYPTYWSVPRIAPARNADILYRSVRSHVQRIHRTFPFDVIVGAFAYPDVVAASCLARDAGCPFVALVMGSDIYDLAQRPALRGRIREALLQAASVVAVSGGLRDRLVELGIPAERIVVQHNGVDGRRFILRDRRESRRRLGLSETRSNVCFVGNLVAEKGPDILIEAIGSPPLAAVSDAHVTFIGDGGLKESLLARATALGIRDRVSFLGRVPPDEVALRISASDVLCLPSRREGCPNVVLEALASGRPVVAAAVGGVPELLHDGNGIMAPSDDPSALARAIVSALRREWDPAALRATVSSLSWDDMGQKLHTVISRAIGERIK